MKKCPTCGAEWKEDIEFCNECGTALTEQGVPTAEAVKPAPTVVTPPEIKVPSPLAKVLVKRGGALTGEEFSIMGDIVYLGRFSPDSGPVDIDLSNLPESNYISRKHARITKEGEEWYIEDLGSTNGVFINRGPRITQKTKISDGDEIALGNLILIFKVL